MVAWWWLVVAAQVGAILGYFIAALMCISGEQSRLEEMREWRQPES